MIPNMIPVIEEQLREKDKEIERLNNIIDELLKFIKDMFVDEAISNSFDMTKEEFINYIKSKLMESDKE